MFLISSCFKVGGRLSQPKHACSTVLTSCEYSLTSVCPNRDPPLCVVAPVAFFVLSLVSLVPFVVLKVVLYILLVMHWVACGWHLLADLENADMSW